MAKAPIATLAYDSAPYRNRLEEGGTEAFLHSEVLPYTPDAWYSRNRVKTGYEISFTSHFYEPMPLRPLEEIRADILALERETEGLLGEIMGGLAVDGGSRNDPRG